MGNGLTSLSLSLSLSGCSPCGRSRRRRHVAPAAAATSSSDDALGHSFCYVRPDHLSCDVLGLDAADLAAAGDGDATMFRSISGAAMSANASTPLSTSLLVADAAAAAAAAAAAGAAAFESSDSFASVPLQPVPRFLSGPISDGSGRGFLSGPIERGFLSGPLDPSLLSGPLAGGGGADARGASLRRSLSHGGRRLRNLIARTIAKESASESTEKHRDPHPVPAGDGIQWAQGKAGEDRVHVVVSEERGSVFVGIYDGFNGPDATDFLLSHLYTAVHHELRGLLWDPPQEETSPAEATAADEPDHPAVPSNWARKRRRGRPKSCKNSDDKHQRGKPPPSAPPGNRDADHIAVLKALARALRKTEQAYLDIAEKMSGEIPELALMGSCVLAMLMKGEDVYVMNVGDSRAVLATRAGPDLEQISEESFDGLVWDCVPTLSAVQLTAEHSTCVQEEVWRIQNEHPDDASAIANDRVKGSLKVTRAFGAGFLKQPKWNNALLEVFRIDYVGTSPYITCNPSLCHHKLGSKDKFLILSSDGLYQYFTNEEAVAQVEMFIAMTPEGDPAQHLIEEVLFRAANKAGMDFHELIEIPHGDRRRYHDDVSVIVISLEGRIWRSCV